MLVLSFIVALILPVAGDDLCRDFDRRARVTPGTSKILPIVSRTFPPAKSGPKGISARLLPPITGLGPATAGAAAIHAPSTRLPTTAKPRYRIRMALPLCCARRGLLLLVRATALSGPSAAIDERLAARRPGRIIKIGDDSPAAAPCDAGTQKRDAARRLARGARGDYAVGVRAQARSTECAPEDSAWRPRTPY